MGALCFLYVSWYDISISFSNFTVISFGPTSSDPPSTLSFVSWSLSLQTLDTYHNHLLTFLNEKKATISFNLAKALIWKKKQKKGIRNQSKTRQTKPRPLEEKRLLYASETADLDIWTAFGKHHYCYISYLWIFISPQKDHSFTPFVSFHPYTLLLAIETLPSHACVFHLLEVVWLEIE